MYCAARRIAGLMIVALALAASAANAGENWRVSGAGTTESSGVDGVDLDHFSGHSTLLGRYTGEGFHILNPVDFTFVGEATYTAANGDELHVEYSGQLSYTPEDDADFPFSFIAEVNAVGGTGRLAEARGTAVMTGGYEGPFSGAKLYFNLDGTLHPQGK
jgi:hypothetical protein